MYIIIMHFIVIRLTKHDRIAKENVINEKMNISFAVADIRKYEPQNSQTGYA